MTARSEVEVEVEHRLGFGMVAALHAVARQAQDIAHLQRRGAQHVALDGDAVVVAAGNLHHRRIADARQQRADRDARHVAMRARAVGGVDAVDPALEDLRALVDVLRVRGIGRIEFGGDGELAAPEHPLKPPARGMAGQFDQRRAGSGPMSWGWGAERRHARLPAAAPARRRSQADEPLRRWSIGGRTLRSARRRACAGCPRRPSPRRRAFADRPRICHRRARRRRGRCAGPSGSSSGRTCRSTTARNRRTCGSRTARPSRGARRRRRAAPAGRSRCAPAAAPRRRAIASNAS